MPLISVGTIKSIENKVELKRRDSHDWSNASVKMNVQDYDTVKTGEASQSEVKFRNESELFIREKSFVIILEKQKENVIKNILELNRGRVRGKIPEGKASTNVLEIRTKNGWISSKKIVAKAQVGNKKTTAPIKTQDSISFDVEIIKEEKNEKVIVKALTGDLEVRTKQQSTTIPQGKKVKIVRKLNEPDLQPEVAVPTLTPDKVDLTIEDDKETVLINTQLPEAEIIFEEETILDEDDYLEARVEVPAVIPTSIPTVIPTPTAGPTPTPVVQVKKAFKIELPESLEFKTSENNLKFKGILTGALTVFLNGDEITATDGRFEQVFQLNAGLNIITIQILDNDTDEISQRVYKVTKI